MRLQAWGVLFSIIAIFFDVCKTEIPVFSLGVPDFFGSGCPQDTVTVQTSNDLQTIFVLFEDYMAETTSQSKRTRRSCNLAVPVTVLSGFSLGVFRVHYDGDVYVPDQANSYADFKAIYFFANQDGPTYSQQWLPGDDERIQVTNNVQVDTVVWSPCGASTIFRINTALTAVKGSLDKGDETYIAIDSVDTTIEKGFRFAVGVKPCLPNA